MTSPHGFHMRCNVLRWCSFVYTKYPIFCRQQGSSPVQAKRLSSTLAPWCVRGLGSGSNGSGFGCPYMIIFVVVLLTASSFAIFLIELRALATF